MPFKKEFSWWVTRCISALLLLNGLWILAESAIHRLPDRFDRFLITDADNFSRQLAVIAGISLVYFSLKLRQGKRHAWYMAIAFIGLFLQYALRHPERHPLGIGISLISLFGLLLEERQFRVRSDTASLRQNMLNIVVVLVVATLYGTVSFTVRDRRDFGREFTPWQSLVRTTREYTLVGNSDLTPRTKEGRLLIDSLDAVGLASVLLIAWSIFRPVRFAIGPTASDVAHAETILRRSSDSPEDFFKLWPTSNKHLYFDESKSAFISYGVVGGVALIVDGPSGEQAEIESVVRSFVDYAHSNGWTVGIIHCDDALRELYESLNFDLLPIGGEAMIDTAEFTNNTSGDKHFRYVRNKFTKLGVNIEYLASPHSQALVAELRGISDEWLQDSSHRERTFMVGYFDEGYIANTDLCVARSASGRIVAYTNLIPVYDDSVASVDIMRYSNESPPGVMNYVYLELIKLLNQKGVKTFNLGLSPLSGIEQEQIDNLPVAALRMIKQLGGGFFSFDGLEQFKNKFRPDWQQRYIAYEGGSTGLARVTVAMLRAIRYKD